MDQITPERAAELIEQHKKARPPRRWQDPDLIRAYAEDMRRGMWQNGDTITIAGPNGWTSGGRYFPPNTILDGWHRLNAVVRSNITIQSELVRW